MGMTAMTRNDFRGHGRPAGFTLIEVMIAMTIFLIVVAAIYQTFHFQQQAYLRNEQIVDMHQEARAAQFFLAKELRMAGYNPQLSLDGPGFTQASRAELQFEADLNGDGDRDSSVNAPDTREIVYFSLSNDDNHDGIADGFPCRLGREYSTRSGAALAHGGVQPIAENVQALEFCYELSDGTATTTPTTAQRARIRSIYISLLLRTAGPVRGYKNNTTYVPASANSSITPSFSGTRAGAWGPFDDAYVRQLAVVRVKCRNLGLNPFGDSES